MIIISDTANNKDALPALKDQQARKWLITINNPFSEGKTRESLMENMSLLMPQYYCGAEEIGASGTHHIHIFAMWNSAIRFSTIKRKFPTAHLDASRGTPEQNIAYIKKAGIWEETDKAETRIEGTFFEFGTLPRSNGKTSLQNLIEEINDGKRTAEIIESNSSLAFKAKDIDYLRQTLLSEHQSSIFRDVITEYWFGKTGTGKTSTIYSMYDPQDIYRVTNYRGGNILFDGYSNHDVLVLEEFHSQIQISEMLNLLDRYPLRLPARYSDKTAFFTRVFITSNLPLEKQYLDIQKRSPETWLAFLRRINKVVEFQSDGSQIETILNNC